MGDDPARKANGIWDFPNSNSTAVAQLPERDPTPRVARCTELQLRVSPDVLAESIRELHGGARTHHWPPPARYFCHAAIASSLVSEATWA
jgi:hypothetical protein